MKIQSLAFFLLCALAVAAGLAVVSLAGDHREAPLIREDPTADIADIYAFLNPNDSDRLVLVMNVNPFSVPAENTTYAFSGNVRYSFLIDNTSDAVAEHRVDVRFSDPAQGPQTYKVFVDSGLLLEGAVTPPTIEPKAIDPIIATGPDGTLGFAGQRDDPFFFDSVGYARFFNQSGFFSGTDGFAGYNVSAIVLDLPVASFLADSSSQLQIWGVTERRQVTLRRSDQGLLEQSYGPWQQIDRMGNPAVNGLISPASKDFFNIGRPENDATDFAGEMIAIMTLLGTNQENIGILTSIVVPDTLKLDTSKPTEFPNGRKLTDDVLDTLVFYLFNQTPFPDGVYANDKEFLESFPFLAPPHQPE